LNPNQSRIAPKGLRIKYTLIVTGWSVLMGVSLAWNIRQAEGETLSMAMATARTLISKDMAFRGWVASHGGVYVTPNAATPPNPYLKVPDRDVVTTGGKALTLMNPAYALRSLQEGADKFSPTRSHITSLRPINPDNAADAWEIEALQQFEKGVREVLDFYTLNGQSHLRLMAPFMVQRDCLKCHEAQGYKVGDVRGGISVDVAMQSYRADEWARITRQGWSHGLLWFLGLLGIGAFYRRVRELETRRELAQRQLAQRDALFRNYFELGRVGMCITSIDHKWLRINRSLCKMLGYSEDELKLMTWTELTHPDDLNLDLAQFDRLLAGKVESYDMDKRFIHKSGNVVYTHLTVTCQRKPEGVVDYFIASLDDITQRKQMEEQVRQLAFHDPLTQLPNRRLLGDRLGQTMVNSKRSGCYCALMFLDLDNFKPVNDRHGHEVGDLLLQEVARRLKACVREIDTVARLGGDEFVVVLGELDVNKDAATEQTRIVAEKIQASLSATYALSVPRDQKEGGRVLSHDCTVSIGVVVFEAHEASPTEVLKWADAMMYEAKTAGRNGIRFHVQGNRPHGG
jgi:diguanylate cyclase (GGDEF)-like protein/PAS domain S-box-containing protein